MCTKACSWDGSYSLLKNIYLFSLEFIKKKFGFDFFRKNFKYKKFNDILFPFFARYLEDKNINICFYNFLIFFLVFYWKLS